MAQSKDFKPKFAPKILSMDPSFSYNGSGFGWAITNQNPHCFGGDYRKPLIDRTGVIKPFSSESSLRNMIELATKLKDIWVESEGFSSSPQSIVIERPVIYPNSPVSSMSLLDLTLFVGVLSQALDYEEIFLPIPREWKGCMQKSDTKEQIENLCDSFSKKNIKRDLESIALSQRHNAYDAMGLGVYVLRVQNKELPYPKMYHLKKAA
jgi:hypothetical protein